MTLRDSAHDLGAKAGLDAAEKDHQEEVAFSVTPGTVEVSAEISKGRLTLAGYGKIVYGATKDYVVGLRGVWKIQRR